MPDTARPRRFGRARHMGLLKKVMEMAMDLAYRGHWAARVSERLGLQGRLVVREHTFELQRRPDAGDIRMVFVSDLHAGPTVHPRLLDETFAAIERARPDLLLIGGDFVTSHARYVDRLIEPLARLNPPLGIYAVLGNHDLYVDDRYLVDRVTGAGVRVLVNDCARLRPPHDDVLICGLDDWYQGAPEAGPAFGQTAGARILMTHGPDGLSVVDNLDFDLAVIGHVHGGQVLVGSRSLYPLRGRLSRRFVLGGVFTSPRGTPLLVSRGIGTSMLPIRVNTSPELHVCTLVPRPTPPPAPTRG